MSRPVRIAHLGLGAFFRAHQAWYTEHSPDGNEWGIAAFTGRSTWLPEVLNAQGGTYTLIERRAGGDTAEPIASVVRAHPGTDIGSWHATVASPDVAVVTLTVTEAGYRPESGIPARLVSALQERRVADGGPIALVSCDNLPCNGMALKEAVQTVAAGDDELSGWIAENVSFVSSVVDRITPAMTQDDQETARRLTGWDDACPVVTEPFSEWILAGEFPAGRPQWDAVGAQFVNDVGVFERRKLWLLNGAHSLLAYAGATRGHTTVADAMDDDLCVRWVNEWWDAAERHLDLDAVRVAAYRSALTERFANPRIRHQLAQIGMDGWLKLPVRILPVIRAELAAGREPVAGARAVAGWLRHLRGETFEVRDPSSAALVEAAAGSMNNAVVSVLRLLDEELADIDAFVNIVTPLAIE